MLGTGTGRLLVIGALGASLPQALQAGLSGAAVVRGAASGRPCLVRAGLRLRGAGNHSAAVPSPPGNRTQGLQQGLQQYGAERPMMQAYYDVDGTVNMPG
jgi:hypothetical protein